MAAPSSCRRDRQPWSPREGDVEVTEYIVSIDPGVSTGVALLSYEKDSTPALVAGWQFSGGVSALTGWLDRHYDLEPWDFDPAPKTFYAPEMVVSGRMNVKWDVTVPAIATVIAEKFTARNTSGFSYTTASLEPLRCEGALIALGLMPDYDPKEKRWRDPGLQYLVGGKDKADKKKRQHRFLKESGFYRTGKDLDAPDADDFRSACAHGLAYLARTGHKPTFDLIAGWE